MRPGGRAALLALASALALGHGPAFGQDREACPGEASPARVVGLTPSGDLLIEGGAAVRIADLRLAESAAALARARAWLASLAGEPVELRRLGPPDRWGRIAARVTLTGRAPVDAAELLVGEGLAIVDAGVRDALCRPDLLGLEARTRAARTGLWGEGVAVLAADDLAGLSARDGAFAIVEGRIVSVGVRRERTYLNFGRDFARDFSVTISRRSWAALASAGRGESALRGRRVRVRGLLEMRRAPGMELVATDMLEVLDAAPRPR